MEGWRGEGVEERRSGGVEGGRGEEGGLEEWRGEEGGLSERRRRVALKMRGRAAAEKRAERRFMRQAISPKGKNMIQSLPSRRYRGKPVG